MRDEGSGIVVEEATRMVVPGFMTLPEARSAIREMVEDDEELNVSAERAEAILDDVWGRRVRE